MANSMRLVAIMSLWWAWKHMIRQPNRNEHPTTRIRDRFRIHPPFSPSWNCFRTPPDCSCRRSRWNFLSQGRSRWVRHPAVINGFQRWVCTRCCPRRKAIGKP
jgi:hypothetical protein